MQLPKKKNKNITIEKYTTLSGIVTYKAVIPAKIAKTIHKIEDLFFLYPPTF